MALKAGTISALLWTLMVAAALTSSYLIVTLVDSDPENPDASLMTFEDQAELEKYLNELRESAGQAYGGLDIAPITITSPNEDYAMGVSDRYFSTTNIQVQGVDEEDMVKTNGEEIFVSTGENVTIIQAVPAESMHILAVISGYDLLDEDLENTFVSISGLFLDGERLVVLAGVYTYETAVPIDGNNEFCRYYVECIPRTVVTVFDVSFPEHPVKEFTVGISGYGLTARLTGGVVYLVTQHYIWYYDEDYVMPMVFDETSSEGVDARSVYYDPGATNAVSYINILAVDLFTGMSNYMSIIASYASTIYMSQSSIYLTYQKWEGDLIEVENTTAPIETYSARTTIHEIGYDGISLVLEASGDVPGWPLNQFSMDERTPYLRVATTTSWTEPSNAVYVLDDDLSIVGELTGIAPTETIYAARFMGETLYLVTFRQIDPLFVIDLSNPFEPKIVGELEVPGFSSYLHPIDETHVLGVGMVDSRLKLSLYDVSDPMSPVETSVFVVEGYYSYSAAMDDHHALTYDSARGILVIPVSVYSPDIWEEYEYSSYCGFYVFELSTTDGISLRGAAAHDYTAQRSVIIGNHLYTLSMMSIKAWTLADLSEVSEVHYGGWDWYRPVADY